jgi:hypothetical protein
LALDAMRPIATFLLGGLIGVVVFGCHTSEPARESKAPAESSAAKQPYVPKDLDDALKQLDLLLGDKGRAEVQSAKESDMIQYHMGIGMWMRNNWGLWAGSRLAQYFNQIGIRHPDDMTGIIFDSYWRKLHGQDIALDAQVHFYQNYWKRNEQSN